MRKSKNIDFLNDDIISLLWKIGLPSSLGFFFNTLNNLVDQFWAGQISISLTTAVGRAFPFVIVLIAVGVGLSAGAGSLIANCLGEKKEKEAEIYFIQSITCSVILYFVIAIPLIFLAKPILILMKTEQEILIRAYNFIAIMMIGGFTVTISQALDSGLRARGLTKYLGISYIITALGNFFLNPILSLGISWQGIQWIPAMEEKGIALSTVITTGFGGIFLYYIVIKKNLIKNFSFSLLIPDMKVIFEIIKQMIPPFLALIAFSLSVFVSQYYIKIATNSEMAIAAISLGFRIEQFAYLPVIGLNIALSTIVGQNNGARLYSRIHETVKKGFIIRYLYLILAMIFIFLIWGKNLTSFFISNSVQGKDQVLTMSQTYLYCAFVNVLFYAGIDHMASMLQGIKKPSIIPFVSFYRMVFAPVIIYSLVIYLGGGFLAILIAGCVINLSASLFIYFYSMAILKNEESIYLEIKKN